MKRQMRQRITPPFYSNAFSSDWTLVYSKAFSPGGGGGGGGGVDCSLTVSAFLDGASTQD